MIIIYFIICCRGNSSNNNNITLKNERFNEYINFKTKVELVKLTDIETMLSIYEEVNKSLEKHRQTMIDLEYIYIIVINSKNYKFMFENYAVDKYSLEKMPKCRKDIIKFTDETTIFTFIENEDVLVIIIFIRLFYIIV